MRINLPTWLTLFRVALLPVMVVVFYAPFRGHNITAAIVFVLAAFTDWLDGYLARRMNLTSAFGAFLDPVADKLMVAVTLFLLVQSHPNSGWSGILMAVTAAVIVGREISVSALRLYHIGEGLLVIAGILTIWSGVYYLRAAWPTLRGDMPQQPPGGSGA